LKKCVDVVAGLRVDDWGIGVRLRQEKEIFPVPRACIGVSGSFLGGKAVGASYWLLTWI